MVLRIVFRQTHKQEVITIDNVQVRIEEGTQFANSCWAFDRSWVRLLDDFSNDLKPRRKLEFGSHGEYFEVGDFLSYLEKDELVFRLKDCIIRALIFCAVWAI